MKKELTLEELEKNELKMLNEKREKTKTFIDNLLDRKNASNDPVEQERLLGLVKLHAEHLVKLDSEDYKAFALDKFNKQEELKNKEKKK
jgi:hypothetical protein